MALSHTATLAPQQNNARRILLDNIGTLYRMDGSGPDSLGAQERAWLLVEGERIAAIGDGDVPPSIAQHADERHRCDGYSIVPGLVDCHTHSLFLGNRVREFALRARGATYAEIMSQGGGIRSTMRHVRSNDAATLAQASLPALLRMSRRGVTTVEIKTGYGLSVSDEINMLHALQHLQKDLAGTLDLEGTLLAAHAIPPEMDAQTWIDTIIKDVIPYCAEQNLARFCDIFVEGGAFSVKQGEQLLHAARDAGMLLRIHAEQLSHQGGTQLAAKMGVVAAGHLEHITKDDAKALADAGVIAEILATAQTYLGLKQHIPGRLLAEAGVKLAVATDYNPGSAYCDDIHLAAGLAITQCGLTAEETLLGMTRYGAAALARRDIGVLAVGNLADLCFIDDTDARVLVAHWGVNHVCGVMKRGCWVHPLQEPLRSA